MHKGDKPILIIAPYLDRFELGEGQLMFRLVEEMSRSAHLTVLAFETNSAASLAEQLPRAEVITWPEPVWSQKRTRLSSMVKPQIPLLHRKISIWLREALRRGRRFTLAHQLLPAAPRYSTPLSGFDIPYVFGPHGGALSTPSSFQHEVRADSLLTRLRGLDGLRFHYDPWLRRSFARADLVLGVAPYMREVLGALPIRRFEPFLGIGIDCLAPEIKRTAKPGQLKMLHVGRAVRTKGLRDTVRAMAQLGDLPDVTLTSVGGGKEIEICQSEAERLGIIDRVRFLGQRTRAEVETLYEQADALIFPSFRESMGAVFYEAMRWGLPVITAARGGPDWIVDDKCGLKVPVTTPEQMPYDLAEQIRRLANQPDLRLELGRAGRAKVAAEALWSAKADYMIALYDDVRTASARST